MRSTAQDLGSAGFDFDHGYGVVGGCALYRRFRPVLPPISIRVRYPELCRPHPLPIDFCRRYPEICRGVRTPRVPPIPDPIGPRASIGDDEAMVDSADDADIGLMLASAWEAGYADGSNAVAPVKTDADDKDCHCKD